MSIGESIIMPSDINIDAMTISMTKNGKNIRNPISKAVFNSDVIKAGSTIFRVLIAHFQKVLTLINQQTDSRYPIACSQP